MKVAILINQYGLKAIAEGRDLQNWHVRGEGIDPDRPDHVNREELKVGTYTIESDQIPTRVQALTAAVESLKAKQQTVLAEAQKAHMELGKQIEQLLALEGPRSGVERVDDIPF